MGKRILIFFVLSFRKDAAFDDFLISKYCVLALAREMLRPFYWI
jgi:hypothetical protein